MRPTGRRPTPMAAERGSRTWAADSSGSTGRSSAGALRCRFRPPERLISGAGGTYAGRAQVGSQLIDVSAGKLYVATAATSSSVTWTVVGTQV
jgi:hypothetical protein